ncbi:hypothetical protein MES5069_10119 [Mesorhizobium escarrei]|uniref:FAD-dependent oxidoreductase 2 FAD-binding domain-containing protein n=1 Tax=Mesorhizobium escarrei TaxID=666018 RepID=A0ABM9DER6_9HYPH|nr:hypothetical protein MES5069_10119 [Mesorhizobium escarrei]
MNALVGGEPLLELAQVEREIHARDRQLDNPFCKDMQITALRGARAYLGDRLIRSAKPHKMLDPANGPLIAVRLNILTRKTLGGLQTDLDSRVLGVDGQPVEGLYAVGEAAGFGGGGMHGYAALEGTFLGGCIFSGRSAGRAGSGVGPSPDPFAPSQSRHRVDDPGKARARSTDRVPGSEITMHQPWLFQPEGVAVCRDDAVAIGLAV